MPIRSACAAKVSYSSQAEAETFARDRDGDSGVYQCPECGRFHLTSWSRRPRWLAARVVRINVNRTRADAEAGRKPHVSLGTLALALMKAWEKD
jgi:hypothetical protein